VSSAVLVEAVWHGNRVPVDDDVLAAALQLARRNQVQGPLARSYPAELQEVLASVQTATALFRRNLTEATLRLRNAGIRPVLIKADPDGDYVYTNFDLVVGEQFERAVRVLAGWFTRTSRHPLEPDKVLLHPPEGPAAHLHTDVSWFGVPVVRGGPLAGSAHETAGGWLVPEASDELRIWLAHAAFQNLALDLSELIALRGLTQPDLVQHARAEAGREGWRRAFDEILRLAQDAITALDHGETPRLPVPLTTATSVAILREHSRHLLRTGHSSTAAREVALRPPLAVVKRLRLGMS
jgi:hypothetical protein